MIDAVFSIDTGHGARDVHLSGYLDHVGRERASSDALAWIKDLRHARVDGQPLRRRFTCRDDSLWWFAEIYLHKQQAVLGLFLCISAIEAMIERERPKEFRFVRGGSLARGLAPQVATAAGIRYRGSSGFGRSASVTLAAMEARASALHASALASRFRSKRPPQARQRPSVAAFVHRAFWQADSGEGSAEAYIGPVLASLEAKLERDRLAYVSLGPASNFRARRWWHPLRGATADDSAIETYAPLSALTESRRIWRERHRARRALWASDDLRQRAVIRGCDCWPVIQGELAGIALLQWPWAARAMDEAAAALDALQPRAAVTYAEAGGWGRALVLECRRRGIPSIGLQHGFIYRHWLNYLHEPDEMIPDPGHPADAGFPRPTLTTLFDEYAARHLCEQGRFPPGALKVTGSPRLDTLAHQVQHLGDADAGRALTAAGLPPGALEDHALVLVAAKFREASGVLGPFIEAAAGLAGVHVAIKTHPAETPDAYARVVDGRTNVTVLSASAPLAPLLRASRAIVTVNSTVALDAAVLGTPSLVIGLPNNLSPFVDAGAMAGVAANADVQTIGHALRRILYDEEFRHELASTRRAFLNRFRITADGGAADRTTAAILDVARGREH